MSGDGITVRSARGTELLTDFIRVPHLVYQEDPNWVAPLSIERREHFNPTKNPYFAHAQVRFFVAYDQHKTPVGRITAQIDNQEEHYATLGHFGCLEAVDKHTMAKLLEAAEAWLREKGIREVTGPFSLSINDEAGLLVSGYHSPPRIMMNYAPAWYADALEEMGYSKAKDLYAYELDADNPFPPTSQKMAQNALGRQNVRERPLDMKNLRADLETVMDIFNDAWSGNWGFTPMTKAEIKHMAKNLRPILDPNMARLIEVDNEPAGMIVALPDVNEALRGLGGKLLPFGWFRLLYRLKIKGVSGGRVVLMGIRQTYQNTRLGGALAAALVVRIHEEGRKRGYKNVELSWILEENTGMSKIIEFVGGTHYKTYRVYHKKLEGRNGNK